MTDPHKPLPPAGKKPDKPEPTLPETDAPEHDWVEGQLPGMPVSRDPLGSVGPTPAQREKRPLD